MDRLLYLIKLNSCYYQTIECDTNGDVMCDLPRKVLLVARAISMRRAMSHDPDR